MSLSYVAPDPNIEAFTCPHCRVYSIFHGTEYELHDLAPEYYIIVRTCKVCERAVLWLDELLLFPTALEAPLPNDDLSETVRADYLEASAIVSRSPRGAAALLRLCVQNICKELGCTGKNINDDVGKLVKEGLSPKVQQALDIVRVVGNNAVHPGEIDIKDDHDTAMRLFTLVNMVADVMISQPKAIQEMYDSLPEGARQAIERRDS